MAQWRAEPDPGADGERQHLAVKAWPWTYPVDG
jgi:hypothetical protein